MRRVSRVVGLLLLFGVLAGSLTGCLRVHAALAISPDDRVSGTLVVAALPVNDQDNGPILTIPPELTERVRSEKYTQDGYVGQKVTFSDLRFVDVAQLVQTISEARQYRLSLRRAGDLVTLAGSIDLTQVPKDRADVQIKVAFPGSVNRTNGTEGDDDAVSWSPKPGAVTEFDAISEYSSAGGESWEKWALMVGGAAGLAAIVATLLALIAHRRSLRADRAQAASVI
ncbi:LppM family (lipo)protein [Actinophytocola sp.]|uniref:LppM family (lipo)protein n=1 Tax=Actinophytocola sp. TaxID=1872138 RepID=UPI002ED03CFC